MDKFFKKAKRVARWGLFASFYMTLQTGYSQTLAFAGRPADQSQQTSPQVLLRTALLDLVNRQQVEIIFDERLLTDKLIPEYNARSGQLTETTLSNILEGTGLHYRKVRRNTYLILKKKGEPDRASHDLPKESRALPPPNSPNEGSAIPSAVAPAAPKIVLDQTVTGRVTDEGGDALPGVSILVKGTQRGTTTNQDGAYTLSVANENTVLVFSFVGYLAQEVTVGNRKEISISLEPDTKALSEVVVVGYGTQKKIGSTLEIG